MTVDRIFLYGVAGLGASLACVVLSIRRQRRFPELGQVATCFLAGPGVVAACWLARQGLVPSEELRCFKELGELRLYLVLGGVAVGWVSLVAIAKECRSAISGTTSAREEDDSSKPPPSSD